MRWFGPTREEYNEMRAELRMSHARMDALEQALDRLLRKEELNTNILKAVLVLIPLVPTTLEFIVGW